MMFPGFQYSPHPFSPISASLALGSLSFKAQILFLPCGKSIQVLWQLLYVAEQSKLNINILSRILLKIFH